MAIESNVNKTAAGTGCNPAKEATPEKGNKIAVRIDRIIAIESDGAGLFLNAACRVRITSRIMISVSRLSMNQPVRKSDTLA